MALPAAGGHGTLGDGPVDIPLYRLLSLLVNPTSAKETTMSIRIAMVLALTMGPLLLAGCNQKTVTKENYDRVENGMSTEEVVEILGEPDDKTSAGAAMEGVTGSTATYSWTDGDRTITVVFVNDKVFTKAQQNL
jgi:hypothetical protein